jgi:hypothetical protein
MKGEETRKAEGQEEAKSKGIGASAKGKTKGTN